MKKYKAQLVVQGFEQKVDIDFFDTYMLVASITTIYILLALTSIHKIFVHQIDVKTTFLHEDIDEEIYIIQPKSFIVSGQEHKVCKLIRSLYRLEQAPKQWHKKFDSIIISYGF